MSGVGSQPCPLDPGAAPCPGPQRREERMRACAHSSGGRSFLLSRPPRLLWEGGRKMHRWAQQLLEQCDLEFKVKDLPPWTHGCSTGYHSSPLGMLAPSMVALPKVSPWSKTFRKPWTSDRDSPCFPEASSSGPWQNMTLLWECPSKLLHQWGQIRGRDWDRSVLSGRRA